MKAYFIDALGVFCLNKSSKEISLVVFFQEILCWFLNSSCSDYPSLFRRCFLCLLGFVIVVCWLVGEVVYIFQMKGLFWGPHSLSISNFLHKNQMIFLHAFYFLTTSRSFLNLLWYLSMRFLLLYLALSHLILHHWPPHWHLSYIFSVIFLCHISKWIKTEAQKIGENNKIKFICLRMLWEHILAAFL